ncbi:hypothetical protein V6N12_015694 [Hibiscus sabdariffa]|uniref:Uncharacterized protein n=1 Tax=Hibiscus sabdariffa TaxID=183260 RepID=A0ABR2DPC9_9ROSI
MSSSDSEEDELLNPKLLEQWKRLKGIKIPRDPQGSDIWEDDDLKTIGRLRFTRWDELDRKTRAVILRLVNATFCSGVSARGIAAVFQCAWGLRSAINPSALCFKEDIYLNPSKHITFDKLGSSTLHTAGISTTIERPRGMDDGWFDVYMSYICASALSVAPFLVGMRDLEEIDQGMCKMLFEQRLAFTGMHAYPLMMNCSEKLGLTLLARVAKKIGVGGPGDITRIHHIAHMKGDEAERIELLASRFCQLAIGTDGNYKIEEHRFPMQPGRFIFVVGRQKKRQLSVIVSVTVAAIFPLMMATLCYLQKKISTCKGPTEVTTSSLPRL